MRAFFRYFYFLNKRFKWFLFGNTDKRTKKGNRLKEWIEEMGEMTRGKFYTILIIAVLLAFGIGIWTGGQMGVIKQDLEKPQVQSSVAQDKFYLAEDHGMVTVYRTNDDSIYEYTNIFMKDLPESIQEEILAKKYMTDEEELYNFLESYTS